MLPSAQRFDTILVGGGLANSLIALACLSRDPTCRLALVERGESLGGNHTWSFHQNDLPASLQNWIDPLVEYRWPGYAVRFPGQRRRLGLAYATFTSQRLHALVRAAFARSENSCLLLQRSAARVEPQCVTLADGEALVGDLVIDGRGPQCLPSSPGCRYQKFVGLEVTLSRPSPVVEPILMDASVSQADGFRFMYILPFTERRVLLEDTYFSDSPEIDVSELERRIERYADDNGFAISRVERWERGVLPLPLAPPRRSPGLPLVSGYMGGWFHATTGYSFPAAVKLAQFVAERRASLVVGADLDALWSKHAEQQRFFCFLNRLLYRGFPPEQRFNVLERFYRLPEPSIGRFYAMQTSAFDRARILCGRPPRGLSFTQALSTASIP